jgi:hypothetical protein
MSQSEDLDAINEYISITPLVTPKATALKNDWVAWWNELSWYGKNVDSNAYNVARNKRDAFRKANVNTAAEAAQVHEVITHGLTTEQLNGLPDPRKADGTFYEQKPPLIPTEYKTIALVTGVLFGGLFAYGLSQSLPKVLLTRGTRPSSSPASSTGLAARLSASPHFNALKARLGVR